MCKMIISQGVFFSFFSHFDFLGCWAGGVKRKKNRPSQEIKVTSVTHHTSGTVYHLILNLGTLKNDDISRQ